MLIALIRAYKRVVSPFFLPACRYTPTCSEYALEAVDCHGAIRGLMLAVGRLLRCHPFVHGGYDPVPPNAGVGPTLLPDKHSHLSSFERITHA